MTTEPDNALPTGKGAKIAKIAIGTLFVLAIIVVIIVAFKVMKNARLHRENEELINRQLKNGSFTINPPAA